MLRCKFLTLGAILVGIAMAGLSPPAARAEFVLILSDGNPAHTVVLKDPGNTGVINFNGAVGNFNIVVTTALGPPAVGVPGSLAELHMNNVSVSTSGGGTLTMTTYDTGYSFSVPAGTQLSMTTTVGGAISPNTGGTGSFTAQAWFDGSNKGNGSALPSFSVPAGSVANFTPAFSTGTVGSNTAFSGTGGAVVSYNGPFAMIQQAAFTFGSQGGNGSFDEVSTVPVPAPAGLVLALSGLPLLGLPYLRRRMKKATA